MGVKDPARRVYDSCSPAITFHSQKIVSLTNFAPSTFQLQVHVEVRGLRTHHFSSNSAATNCNNKLQGSFLHEEEE
jgi:hypothetical protein